MSLKKELLKRQIEDVEHDLLQKRAYVAVRWARSKFTNDEGCLGHAISRLQNQYPKVHATTIEEAVFAMNFNIGA